MPTEARAIWFTSPRSVEIRSVDVGPPEEGAALVRATHSGISPGTEMLAFRGEVDPDLRLDESIGSLDGSFRYPFRFGYSSVGVVEESRSSVSEGTQVFAFHPHQDLFNVVDADLIPIPAIAAREATLFPLVETAFQIDLETGVEPGQRIMVLGLGPVGALTSLLLVRRGVEVVGVDPLPWRRSFLSGLGLAGLTVADPLEVAESTPPGLPLVVEASGNPQAVRLGLRSLAHEGALLVASWFGNREVAVPLGGDFHRRRLTIVSTQVSTIPARLAADWTIEKRRRAVIELMPELPLGALATHTFEFKDAPSAYDAVDQREEGLIHAALAYD